MSFIEIRDLHKTFGKDIHAVRGVECADALALAVSLKLSPLATLGAASAGMLSSDGRCKTLDARANGYARSEGIGSLVVRFCEGGAPSGLLSGSAVRQDGRSASLTAPNGSAQRTLLLAQFLLEESRR